MNKTILLFLSLLAFTTIVKAQPLPNLIPYLDGNKWGYCDSNGHVIIKPKWTRGVNLFKNGRAWVYTQNGQGVINESGEYIIPPYRHWNGKSYTSVIGAHYNARSKKGKYGIIDSNNRELLPCIYDKTEWGNGFLQSGFFFWDKRHNKYVGKVRKNGKYGLIDTLNQTLIPFEYDGISTDTCCTFGSPKFYSVIITKSKEWKHGIIAAGNRVVIPPIYRNAWLDPENYNQIMLFKEKTTIIADSNGKITWEKPGYSLGWPRHAHATVQDSTGKYGLMNDRHELVIPCIYPSVRIQHDTIVLTKWSDTTPNKFQQFKYCDIRTYRELSDWLTYEQHMKLSPRVEKVQEEHHNTFPYSRQMRIKGRDVFQYKTGDMLWVAIDYPKKPERLIPVRGIADGDSLACYSAVIDSNGNYVIAPRKTHNEIRVLNATDSLVLVQPSNKGPFQVEDFHGEVQLPFQKYDIKAAFYYNDTFYAVVDHEHSHWEYSYRKDFQVTEHTYHLITANGKPARGMEQYRLHWFTDRNGRRMGNEKWDSNREDGFNTPFGGYLTVEDSTGKWGIVSIDGRVQLPDVSFKYVKLYPIGPDVFLVDNRIPEHNGYYYPEIWPADKADATKLKNKLRRGFPYLVNRRNEVLLDSLTVETIVNTAEPRASPLYVVYLPRRADHPYDKFRFYMNGRGKAYYRKLLSR